MPKKEKPNLKKSDLLAALKDKKGDNRTDLTMEALEKGLARKFEFIPAYFAYLFALYKESGKFTVAEVEDDDGHITNLLTIKEVGQVRTSPRTIFEITTAVEEQKDEDDELYEVLVVECVDSILKPGDKLPDTHSLSKVSAVKIAKKQAYRDYKEACDAMDAWLKDDAKAVAEALKEAA